MKKLLILTIVALTMSCSQGESIEPSTTINFQNSGKIYFENGTCKCPEAALGDQDKIEGIVYTAVNNSSIRTEINKGEYLPMHNPSDRYVRNIKPFG